MKVWALKDFRIGSSKQTDFLAKKLSNDVIEKNIEYTKLIAIPNCIKPYKMGIDFEESDDLLNLKEDEYPDIIIFAGRRLAGIAIYLKKYIFKKFKKEIKIISILNPNYSFKNFDFVLLPQHDEIIKDKYNNILKFEGSLCNPDITAIIDEKTKDFWEDKLKNYKKPYYFFVVGGNTKNKKFNIVKFAELVKKISNFVKKQNGTLLISTSRRTTDNYIKVIEKNLNCSYYLYKWGKSAFLNPYYYFVKEGEISFVTGDSISMITEIITIGKPVYVYMPEESLEEKHISFCNSILDKNLIKKIELSKGDNFEKFKSKPLNELDRLANHIKSNLQIITE